MYSCSVILLMVMCLTYRVTDNTVTPNIGHWELGRQAVGGGSGMPIGSIITYISTTPPDNSWLLCDGGTFSPTTYPDLYIALGNRDRLPDLNEQFIRGTAVGGKIAGFTKHNDTTRLPRSSSFRTDQQGNHHHDIAVGNRGDWVDAAVGNPGAIESVEKNWVAGPHQRRMPGDTVFWNAGDHSHAITSGGDAETAPKHVYLAYFIKAL